MIVVPPALWVFGHSSRSGIPALIASALVALAMGACAAPGKGDQFQAILGGFLYSRGSPVEAVLGPAAHPSSSSSIWIGFQTDRRPETAWRYTYLLVVRGNADAMGVMGLPPMGVPEEQWFKYKSGEAGGSETVRLFDRSFDLLKGRLFLVDKTADPATVSQLDLELPLDVPPDRDLWNASVDGILREESSFVHHTMEVLEETSPVVREFLDEI